MRRGSVLVWTGDAGTAPRPPQHQPAPRPAPLAYTPPYLAEKILTSRSALEGERKQVTVLFADLKGSTELIRDLDPEAAQQLLDPALQRMMDAVHRFEGTVNQVLGDGIMALFGAPIAHEDHAVRACYAALAMQAAMQPLCRGGAPRPRPGAAACAWASTPGKWWCGRLATTCTWTTPPWARPRTWRRGWSSSATPGSIRLTAATLRLVEGLVQVTALGPVPVKGLAEPVEVFELVGASALRRRLQAAAARGLTPLCGAAARAGGAAPGPGSRPGPGMARWWPLVGEAGVGKSRLVYEFVHSHHTQGWRVLESASVSYGKATPYFPVIDLLKRYCHVDDSDDTRTIRAKVTGQVLTLDETLQDTLPALLALLDALPDDSPFLQPRPAAAPPAHARRRSSACCCAKARCSRCSWSLRICTGSTPRRRPCSTAWSRACPRPGCCCWSTTGRSTSTAGAARPTTRNCGSTRCPRRAPTQFLQALLGDDPSLAPLTQLLIARTEGNPFFLEESVRTLVETGVLVGEPGAYRLAQPLDSLQVPATVQAVLAARIDRLPPEEKRLLQTAAVIGTEVPLPLLQAIAELPEEALHRGLAHLQAAEFLYETRLFPEREYTFKHALTHEVAYGSLLQERRRVLHARIVEALEALARRPAGRAGRTPGAPCPAGRGVGQGRDLLPAGRRQGLRPRGVPRGGGLLRAGPPGPRAPARGWRHAGCRPSSSASRWAARCTHWESMGGASPCWARPRPWPGRSTIGPGWDGCWPGWPMSLRLTGDLDGAMAAGQQALALAADARRERLAGASIPSSGADHTMPSATSAGRPSCCGGTWRLRTGSLARPVQTCGSSPGRGWRRP